MGKSNKKKRMNARRAQNGRELSFTPAEPKVTEKEWYEVVLEKQKEEIGLEDAVRALGLDKQKVCTKKKHPKGNCTGNVFCLSGCRICAEISDDEDCECFVDDGKKVAAARAERGANGGLAPEWMDPACKELRESVLDESGVVVKFPVGFRNPGCLCYVNTLLQTLVECSHFRKMVFQESVRADAEPLVHTLAQLAAVYEGGVARSVQIRAVAENLGLDIGYQQDPQEFRVLLMSYIEALFLDASPLAKMYSGKMMYATQCTKCKNKRSLEDPFNFVSLGFEKSLEESIAAFFRVDHMVGENQIMCETCNEKCDGLRQVMISELPDILCISLPRLFYDPTTHSKKKSKEIIKLPLVLKKNLFVRNTPEEQTLELCGVICHSGVSANGGHYTCLIRPEKTYRWFEINDDKVRDVSDYMFDRSDGKQTRAKSKARTDFMAKIESECYMLFYRDLSSYEPCETSPPAALMEQVAAVNRELEATVQARAEQQCMMDQRANEKKDIVQNIIDSMRDISREQPFPPSEIQKMFAISRRWWEKFITCDDVGPIDNSDIMCEHGVSFALSSKEKMKLLTEDAFALLSSVHECPVPLPMESFCRECLLQEARTCRDGNEKETMIAFVKSKLPKQFIPGDTEAFWISDEWLKEWMASPVEVETNTECNPTTFIECSHGNLSTDASRRVAIGSEAFMYFNSIFPAMRTFPKLAEPCAMCKKTELDHNAHVKGVEKRRIDSKQHFAKLFDYKTYKAKLANPGEERFYLASKAGFDNLRRWITVKEMKGEPPLLLNTDIICRHDNLLVEPTMQNFDHGDFYIVGEEFWPELVKRYGKPETIVIPIVKLTKDEIVTERVPCPECMEEARLAAEYEKTHYENGKLTIKKLPGTFSSPDAVVAKILDTPSEASAPPKGRQTRSSTKQIQTKEITDVNSGMDVASLKMHLLYNFSTKAFEVPDVFNQLLLYNAVPMKDHEKLESIGVENGGTVYLATMACSSDEWEFTSSQEREIPAERGFVGTKLVNKAQCSQSVSK